MSAATTRSGPLAGRTVAITRAASQAASLRSLLEAAGADVLEAPTIAIEPPPSWEPLDAALGEIERFRWVVFTSVNGVAMVGRRLEALGIPWSAIAARRVAAIGPATAGALREHDVPVALVPEEYRAESLADGLRAELAPGDHVLLPRAARTRDVLVRQLEALGAVVREVAAYVTRRVEDAAARVREAVAARRVDVVTLTSSSTARHFAELFTEDERRAWLAGVTIAAIGPITAATAAEYGLTSHVMPVEYTIPALVRAIEAHFEQRSG
ncbi:MAG: uroporphyrinogen-III synthase [Candidatus Rokubacteria bacterium]|nr:uroporphyrinogen-III synthase [Candidatus Rokubacteria bacterium]